MTPSVDQPRPLSISCHPAAPSATRTISWPLESPVEPPYGRTSVKPRSLMHTSLVVEPPCSQWKPLRERSKISDTDEMVTNARTLQLNPKKYRSSGYYANQYRRRNTAPHGSSPTCMPHPLDSQTGPCLFPLVGQDFSPTLCAHHGLTA